MEGIMTLVILSWYTKKVLFDHLQNCARLEKMLGSSNVEVLLMDWGN